MKRFVFCIGLVALLLVTGCKKSEPKGANREANNNPKPDVSKPETPKPDVPKPTRAEALLAASAAEWSEMKEKVEAALNSTHD